MIEILCKDDLNKCIDYAHTNRDNTLNDCLLYLIHLATLQWCDKIRVTKDHCTEKSFDFWCFNAEDKCVLNGGIIFHGARLPGEKTQTNGAYKIEPKVGWQIHT